MHLLSGATDPTPPPEYRATTRSRRRRSSQQQARARRHDLLGVECCGQQCALVLGRRRRQRRGARNCGNRRASQLAATRGPARAAGCLQVREGRSARGTAAALGRSLTANSNPALANSTPITPPILLPPCPKPGISPSRKRLHLNRPRCVLCIYACICM